MPLASYVATVKRNWLFVACSVVAITAVVWICTFKIMDRDFWWHIKAGEIFVTTQQWITTDPFAYTRTGLPYLATHEWLAQILLYLVYHLAGPTGIILFRALIACVSMALLLALGRRKNIAFLVLGVWAIVMTKGSFLERPQLFTFVLFAAFLFLAFRFLDATSNRLRQKICAAFVVLELLWVNMHGGAALLGCAVVSFLLLQYLAESIDHYKRRQNRQTVITLLATLLLMSITLILPPNGYGTLEYLSQLLHDQTIAYIAEWQPRTWLLYVKELWPFYLFAVTALITGKRHWVYNALVLVATAYLSRKAFRHEILFVFASVATCVYQFDRSNFLEQLWKRWHRGRLVTGIVIVIAAIVLGKIAYDRSFWFERQDNLFGFGQFDLARGAYDFIEKENVQGNMFNTYGIGGYLIYRGYPHRKVFIDGRNVDYGFDFMTHAYAAGSNPDEWKKVVNQYGITYAIVDYDAIKLESGLPYSSHLDKDPDWPLVYLDDWAAVYVQKIPLNQSIIDRKAYRHIDATTLQYDDDLSDVPTADLPEAIQELQRMQDDSPQSIKATIALAKIALRENRLEDALVLAARANALRPQTPEPLAITATVAVRQEQWQQAAQIYGEILRLAGDNYPNINYGFIAAMYQKAGHPFWAWYYNLRRTSLVQGVPSQIHSSSSSSSISSPLAPSLGVNPAADALEFQEKGLQQAQSGQFTDAEASFRAAIMMNPSLAEAWNNLCALQLSQKLHTQAIVSCKRAVEINTQYADAHYNLALAYFSTKAMTEAKKEALLAKKFGRATESEKLLLLIAEMKL